jgi:predicted enzyme related to lactoylglutathione lyase
MADHGTFYWNELMCRDAKQAKAFYATTIDWTFDGTPMPDGGTIAKMNGKPAAGVLPMGPGFQGRPTDTWFAYLAVDEVDVRVGRIAILQEPGGAHVGWMTPAPSPA